MQVFFLLVFVCTVHSWKASDESIEKKDDSKTMAYYKFLYKRMKQHEEHEKKSKKAAIVPTQYVIPGPFEPLPGRSHYSDYWPLFPFSNQYSGGLDLDPSISRHIGGDLNIPVPSWGILDISGRFFNRIRDTVTKFGYLSHPINMMGLTKEDYVRLMSDPSLAFNRNAQPLIPLGKVPRSNVPLSCRPPLCNPYTQTFAVGVEHDFGGSDGAEGDINVPIPIGKDLAYRFPLGGNVYYGPGLPIPAWRKRLLRS
uniref:Conserved secreted protein n=1 Tax=Steinernema glaseri TaxID=37863 RepID=A0A1I7ZZH5_9BILA